MNRTENEWGKKQENCRLKQKPNSSWEEGIEAMNDNTANLEESWL